MKINLETTEPWVTKAERWLTAEEERDVDDAVASDSSIHLQGVDLWKIKYSISIDAGPKAKYKHAHTKERDPICTAEFPGRELGSQASQSSELLTDIQEAWVYWLAQRYACKLELFCEILAAAPVPWGNLKWLKLSLKMNMCAE